MAKGRFLNQKLGKRTDRKSQLLKARVKTQLPARSKQLTKSTNPQKPSR